MVHSLISTSTHKTFFNNVIFGNGISLLHESQNLTSVSLWQHNLQINALNKGNTYLPSMRSISYIRCYTYAYIQRVNRYISFLALLLYNMQSNIWNRFNSPNYCVTMSMKTLWVLPCQWKHFGYYSYIIYFHYKIFNPLPFM